MIPKSIKSILIGLLLLIGIDSGISQDIKNNANHPVREHILMDLGWRFALGHASDFEKDFKNRTSHFTYFAKAGYGDGAAAPDFEDRTWREVDLPHDWAAELPFSSTASQSHGYRTIGWKYPETSVGWYRKRLSIPTSDFGKKISIQFDGIYRDATVWINGFYLGNEPSGYASIDYDITDYLNYGGENVIAVRVDASIEEGWFYEGAGIYRHVWLNKTDRLHVANYGTFVTSEIKGEDAEITIRTTIENQYSKTSTFSIVQTLRDANNQPVATASLENISLRANLCQTYFKKLQLAKPYLWLIEKPYLYTLETQIISENKCVDIYKTTIGIRTINFDPDKGFFLNGQNIKIKGVNNHQDHAGVGVAIPDALQEYRVKKIKEMGCNAIRTSHNPPTPELLDICDRLGMLILDENRLMGINQEHFELLKRFMIRDRNHPCVILWSLGNEEWKIEGNEKGERITRTMQEFAKTIDSSRAFTVAISGGWDWGSGKSVQVIGYNYIAQGNIDEHHKLFPWQSGVGTEETNTIGTRGVYVDDRQNGHMKAIHHFSDSVGAEYGWRFYLARSFLSGLFYWTGFDYHGEPFPIYWPQVNTQYGIFDLCGYPKDIYYYFKSWWKNEPVIHISTHWNNPAGLENRKESKNQKINVTVYSNAEEVELILNNKKLGRKKMPINGHLEWDVTYEPGKLMAKGYIKNKELCVDLVETVVKPSKVLLSPERMNLIADGGDVAIIKVEVKDKNDRFVPTANNEILFTLNGPGRIIAVGNGDPSSHDPEQYLEKVDQVYIGNLKYTLCKDMPNDSDITQVINDSEWFKAFEKGYGEYEKDKNIIIRGAFNLSGFNDSTAITFFAKSLAADQSIFINGKLIGKNIKRGDPNQVFVLDHNILKNGENEVVFAGKPFIKQTQWEEINTNPGTIKIHNPAPQWKCKVFNGLAQIIVRTTSQAGEITLTAKSEGLAPSSTRLISKTLDSK